MAIKLVDVSQIESVSAPRELTQEQHDAAIAQYKAERALDNLEAEYVDFDEQVAAGVPAEQLLQELRQMQSNE